MSAEKTKTTGDDEIDALTREYAAWNKAQGLNLGSADEHLANETLTARMAAVFPPPLGGRFAGSHR